MKGPAEVRAFCCQAGAAARSSGAAMSMNIRRSNRSSIVVIGLPPIDPVPDAGNQLVSISHEITIVRSSSRAGVIGQYLHPAADREVIEIQFARSRRNDPVLLIGR